MDVNMLRQELEAVLEKIREGLKTEGGDIQLIDVRDGVVYVKLMGSCEGCPMSSLTMKNWVEQTIKKELPEVTSVRAV
jgi:Fe-S cluster biogenesis protein NfuA